MCACGSDDDGGDASAFASTSLSEQGSSSILGPLDEDGLVARASHEWTRSVEGGNHEPGTAVVNVNADGTFVLTTESDVYPGEWTFDAGRVSVSFGGGPIAYEFDNVTGESGTIVVSGGEDEPRSGVFDIDVRSDDRVLLHQTEGVNRDPVGEGGLRPQEFDCTR